MKKLISVLMLLALMLTLGACGKQEPAAAVSDIPGLEDGVFTVGMECAYAPYNWRLTSFRISIKSYMSNLSCWY